MPGRAYLRPAFYCPNALTIISGSVARSSAAAWPLPGPSCCPKGSAWRRAITACCLDAVRTAIVKQRPQRLDLLLAAPQGRLTPPRGHVFPGYSETAGSRVLLVRLPAPVAEGAARRACLASRDLAKTRESLRTSRLFLTRTHSPKHVRSAAQRN